MAKRHRILYIDMAHGMGGSLVSLYQLLKGLDKERYEPIVLFYWDNPLVSRFRELGIETIVWSGPRQESDSLVPVSLPRAVERPRRWLSKATWMARLYHGLGFYARFIFQTLPLAWRISLLIRQHDVDLIHANDLLTYNREVVLAAHLTGRPCVCHVRAFEHYTPIDRLLSQFVDRFIFISQAIADDTIAQGAEPAKGTVIYNALALDEFLQAMEQGDAHGDVAWHDHAARSSLGLSPDHRVVGIVGRLVPWKGQHIFLKAMGQVQEAIPHLQCLIVGDAAPSDTAYKEELIALAAELGMADRVHFLGWRNDVPHVLSALDVLVHASLEPEPFGRVLIEGMAASKAVVASQAGACPEIIQDGVSGLLVPPGDHDALAQAVISLLQDRHLLHTMGVVARHQVETRFSIAEHVRGMEAVYDNLLGSQASQRPAEG